MAYTFLLFDLDHTLLDFDTAEEVALTQFLQDQGVQDIQAFKDYYKPMNQGLWKDLEQKKISKKDLINSRFAIAFAHFGREVDGEEMALRYQDYISQQGQSFPGAEDLLSKIVKRGYKIYVAKNGVTDNQKGRLRHSTFREPKTGSGLLRKDLEPDPRICQGTSSHDWGFFDGGHRWRECCGD